MQAQSPVWVGGGRRGGGRRRKGEGSRGEEGGGEGSTEHYMYTQDYMQTHFSGMVFYNTCFTEYTAEC